jgi:hypothetical protein
MIFSTMASVSTQAARPKERRERVVKSAVQSGNPAFRLGTPVFLGARR